LRVNFPNKRAQEKVFSELVTYMEEQSSGERSGRMTHIVLKFLQLKFTDKYACKSSE
jgi:hypothetical protein